MINTKDKGKVKRFVDERKIKSFTLITQDDFKINDKTVIINLIKVLLVKGGSVIIIEE